MRDRSAITLLASVALAATILGRYAEQMTGVPRITDTMMFWLIVGLVIAIPAVINNKKTASQDLNTVSKGSVPTLFRLTGKRQALLSALLVLVVSASIPAIAYGLWMKNIAYAIADHELQLARDMIGDDPNQALEHYNRAITLAPDVRKYSNEKSDLLLALAEVESNTSTVVNLQYEAYSVDLKVRDINPMDRDANFKLAASAWNLALTGVPGKALETVEIYEYLLSIAPEHELVRPRLEQLYKATGISSDRS